MDNSVGQSGDRCKSESLHLDNKLLCFESYSGLCLSNNLQDMRGQTGVHMGSFSDDVRLQDVGAIRRIKRDYLKIHQEVPDCRNRDALSHLWDIPWNALNNREASEEFGNSAAIVVATIEEHVQAKGLYDSARLLCFT